jgi:hypothetical protein
MVNELDIKFCMASAWVLVCRLPRNQVSIRVSVMVFAQTLSGAIFVSVGQGFLDRGVAQMIVSIRSCQSHAD